MLSKMLVPLDGSEISESILAWVAHLATRLEVPVVLISLMDPSGPPLTGQVATG
jgi:hypothetical protein